jgi:uncharacterized secreted repeat protein (TIGR03808 family)
MDIDRRHLLMLGAVAAGAGLNPVRGATAAPPIAALGLDTTHFGLHPSDTEDQTRLVQRAVEEASRARVPLALPPGIYRVGNLKLPAGAQLVGVRGATRLVLTKGPSLLTAEGADHVSLSNLVFDGAGQKLPERRGLVQIARCRAVRIVDCEIVASGGNGLQCESVQGEVSGTTLSKIADVAILSDDAEGLLLARNSIDSAGNNGIQIIRRANGDDGTIIVDNRIEDVANRSGGSGQYGNGINAFRAANVIVRGNRIRRCAFSAVRGNAASNIVIEGNNVTDVGEVALYAEFGFEGAVITNNIVDGAAIGICATNFNRGGRLAIVQGNLIRNLKPKRPAGTDPGDSAGVGISVEGDAAVSGNLVENAPLAGIMLGWGPYLRDVAVTGNVVRKADIGIAVSVAPGAASTIIANNIIAESGRGAIVGMVRAKAVTADLSKSGSEIYAHLRISGNEIR